MGAVQYFPQVSSSCTSVYIDGSETRGAISAEVKVKYGTFSGQVSLLCNFLHDPFCAVPKLLLDMAKLVLFRPSSLSGCRSHH